MVELRRERKRRKVQFGFIFVDGSKSDMVGLFDGIEGDERRAPGETRIIYIEKTILTWKFTIRFFLLSQFKIFPKLCVPLEQLTLLLQQPYHDFDGLHQHGT